MCLDISILAKSIIDRREYFFFISSPVHLPHELAEVDAMVEPVRSMPPAHLRVRLRGGRRRRVALSPGRAPAYLGSPQSTASAFGDRAPPLRGLLLR
jgi:hypothetical protein